MGGERVHRQHNNVEEFGPPPDDSWAAGVLPANAGLGAAKTFQARRWNCHSQAQVSDLDLRSREKCSARKRARDVIVPEDAEHSRLYGLIAGVALSPLSCQKI